MPVRTLLDAARVEAAMLAAAFSSVFSGLVIVVSAGAMGRYRQRAGA
ncbi:hypothetical protein AB0A95_03295 [Micromonospora sp. NPDC049230]